MQYAITWMFLQSNYSFFNMALKSKVLVLNSAILLMIYFSLGYYCRFPSKMLSEAKNRPGRLALQDTTNVGAGLISVNLPQAMISP